MARIAAVLMLSVLLASVLACESGDASDTALMRAPIVTATPMPTIVPSYVNWSGIWDTEWGLMFLVQTGANVSGTFGRNDGIITGTASGDSVIGTWSEWPSFAPPNDAGDIWLELTGNYTTLTGHWRWGSRGDWYGTWPGKRLSYSTPIPGAIQ